MQRWLPGKQLAVLEPLQIQEETSSGPPLTCLVKCLTVHTPWGSLSKTTLDEPTLLADPTDTGIKQSGGDASRLEEQA